MNKPISYLLASMFVYAGCTTIPSFYISNPRDLQSRTAEYIRNGNYETTLATCSQYLTYHPEDHTAHITRSAVLMYLGRYQEGSDEYTRLTQSTLKGEELLAAMTNKALCELYSDNLDEFSKTIQNMSEQSDSPISSQMRFLIGLGYFIASDSRYQNYFSDAELPLFTPQTRREETGLATDKQIINLWVRCLTSGEKSSKEKLV